MLKVILLLVYMWQTEPYTVPELRVEQTVYATAEDCQIAGGKKAREIATDPKFVEGLFAACIPSRVTQATR